MIASFPTVALRDAEVLVLAPRFPSINQPWMDSYLEQLDRAGRPFVVVSHMASPDAYHAKVDRAGWRRRTILAPAEAGAVARTALGLLARRPVATLRAAAATWPSVAGFAGLRGRVAALCRALHALAVADALPALLVVHTHSLDLGHAFLPLTRQRGLPLVVTFHGLNPAGVPQVPAHMRQAVFDAASAVLVNTEFAKAHAVELGCPPAKVVILPQGLPLEDFPFAERTVAAPDRPVQLLSVGRFHRDKGQQYSLLAARRLAKAGLPFHWHFVGVGPNLPRLQHLVRRLGLADHVTFHVALDPDRLRALYQASDLFVLASVASEGGAEHVETQGVVLQEAQASGCIPIATRVGGIPECVTDGVDGLLVTDRSHRAIADAVQAMCARRAEWPQFARHARANVERRFSATAVGDRMAAILRQAASAGAPRR